MATIHELKILPSFFAAVRSGKKRFEIRKNDRHFEEGDEVLLMEWDGDDYTGSDWRGRITYITDWAQRAGFVVFSIEPLESERA